MMGDALLIGLAVYALYLVVMRGEARAARLEKEIEALGGSIPSERSKHETSRRIEGWLRAAGGLVVLVSIALVALQILGAI